jgi:serine/threonine protein kinase
MATRLPAPAPSIPGFTHLNVLGAGGFADVHLYAQERPRRDVAIKVLLDGVVNPSVVAAFNSEADIMAALGAHPSILTVHASGISTDGRPYLVTEYCPGGFGESFRQQPLPVADVLAIGVKMASALESAHRLNVLHRDVKPGNILVTSYGTPVLSDFGIAASLRAGEESTLLAMSVPWTAPEVITGSTTGTVSTDVWGLGATLYSLLAGHSPFELPEKGANSREQLAKRILKARPTTWGRTDVPHELAVVLGAALNKDPLKRPATMLEFGRALQDVQRTMSLPITPIEFDTNAAAKGDISFSNTSTGSTPRSQVPVTSVRKGRASAAAPDKSATSLPATKTARNYVRTVSTARASGWLIFAIVALAGMATLFALAILGVF